jgi:hypothetical protein
VTLPLDSVDAVLAALPARPGVGQFLAAGPPEGGRNLLIGRTANLRKWAASHLGAGPPPKPGKRPPLDLRPVAASVRYLTATGDVRQRLLFERLMARYVPLSSRRDVKPPAWLHLDVGERFPRLSVRGPRAARAGGPLYGPFRDARAAGRARDALHRRVALRPCDYSFEPDPALELGLGCVYAQTRSCAAPCLSRMAEVDYVRLARGMEEVLRGPRPDGDDLPAWVSARSPLRALIADPLKGACDLFPLRDGYVIEGAAVQVGEAALEEAVRGLSWDVPGEGESDWPWLLPWLHAPRRKGRYLVLEDALAPDALAARIRRALG